MELADKARDILVRNDRGGYTVPTKGLYPFQWNWDSAFAAWGFSTFNIKRAWQEFETLFSGQWANGMVPHIIFHQEDEGYFPGPDIWSSGTIPPSSGISQPPVAATMMRRVYEANTAIGFDQLRIYVPKLIEWHRWWMTFNARTGVAAITHTWESGRDNCPDWDPGMAQVDGSHVGPYTRRDTGHVDPDMRPKKIDYDRFIAKLEFGRATGWDQEKIINDGPFLMADPAITFILLRAHRDLKYLAEILSADTAEIDSWITRMEAALPSLWNEDIQAYDAKNLRDGQFVGSLGSGTFLAFYGGVNDRRSHDQLMRVWNACQFGIPSHDPESPAFDSKRYWRGPSWPVMNSIIAMGLREQGYHEEAARLANETREMITRHGFFEYFDSMTGDPCGGTNFTWTAAIWLAWLEKV